jgi:hypothetical protein
MISMRSSVGRSGREGILKKKMGVQDKMRAQPCDAPSLLGTFNCCDQVGLMAAPPVVPSEILIPNKIDLRFAPEFPDNMEIFPS